MKRFLFMMLVALLAASASAQNNPSGRYQIAPLNPAEEPHGADWDHNVAGVSRANAGPSNVSPDNSQSNCYDDPAGCYIYDPDQPDGGDLGSGSYDHVSHDPNFCYYCWPIPNTTQELCSAMPRASTGQAGAYLHSGFTGCRQISPRPGFPNNICILGGNSCQGYRTDSVPPSIRLREMHDRTEELVRALYKAGLMNDDDIAISLGFTVEFRFQWMKDRLKWTTGVDYESIGDRGDDRGTDRKH